MKTKDKIVIGIMAIITVIGIIWGITGRMEKSILTIQAQPVQDEEKARTVELVQGDEEIIEYLYGPMKYVDEPLYGKFWKRTNGMLKVWYIIPAGPAIEIEEIFE
jgi:hypothetical protein